VERAAAFLAVAHSVGFGASTTVLLGLTPQALCCRAAPQAQIGAFKTRSEIHNHPTHLCSYFIRPFDDINPMSSRHRLQAASQPIQRNQSMVISKNLRFAGLQKKGDCATRRGKASRGAV